MRSRRMGLIWLILLGLLLKAELAHGALTFKSEAQVAGEYITLAHLADFFEGGPARGHSGAADRGVVKRG
ncbi:MAG: hypothetical protein P8X65_03725 [Syntrophobacterales bacterium]